MHYSICPIMFENHLYNLILQLTQEHKSLWRIRHHYKKDAGDCADCKKFWDDLEKEKKDHIDELTKLIKTHLA